MIHRPGGASLLIPGLTVVQPRGGAAEAPWWLSGGISASAILAAYQPKGAADLASSYVNLTGNSTYDAAPGTAPTWDATNGWKFASASSQFLSLGMTLNSGYSVLIRFTGLVGGSTTDYFFGAQMPRYTLRKNSGMRYLQGDEQLVAADAASGVIGAAGTQGYFNGAAGGSAVSASANGNDIAYIGALNSDGTAIRFTTLNVQALAVYNATLTADQMAAVTTAMNLL